MPSAVHAMLPRKNLSYEPWTKNLFVLPIPRKSICGRVATQIVSVLPSGKRRAGSPNTLRSLGGSATALGTMVRVLRRGA
jgi:hypothetical protein